MGAVDLGAVVENQRKNLQASLTANKLAQVRDLTQLLGDYDRGVLNTLNNRLAENLQAIQGQ